MRLDGTCRFHANGYTLPAVIRNLQFRIRKRIQFGETLIALRDTEHILGERDGTEFRITAQTFVYGVVGERMRSA